VVVLQDPPGYEQEKDRVLDRLADTVNVAQFVSFAAGKEPTQRFSRVRGWRPNHRFATAQDAIGSLLAASPEGAVNIRTFRPETPKGGPFFLRLCHAGEILHALWGLSREGFYTIVNETVDVNDGGVSGVVLGDVLEFAPDDTPRCVDKPGTVAIERRKGLRILETVYRFRPALDFPPDRRVEFSIHPKPRGVRSEHTTIWELEHHSAVSPTPRTDWPNHFSRLIGDKAFGLLVADVFGLAVPRTTVISRRVAPFSFGRPTGTSEVWFRTCPFEQMPGKLKTTRGWSDPFQVVAEEDPDGNLLSSVLSQQAINAQFSGAAASGEDGALILEGTVGTGDPFMLGERGSTDLPAEVVKAVRVLHQRASALLGPIRCEWVYDRVQSWVVQLHRGTIPSRGQVIYPGMVKRERHFEARDGLEALRQVIPEVQRSGEGMVIDGDIGVLSHMGDLLRKAKIPSRIEHSNPGPPEQAQLAWKTG